MATGIWFSFSFLTFMPAIIFCSWACCSSSTVKGGPGLRSAGNLGGLPLQLLVNWRHNQLVNCDLFSFNCITTGWHSHDTSSNDIVIWEAAVNLSSQNCWRRRANLQCDGLKVSVIHVISAATEDKVVNIMCFIVSHGLCTHICTLYSSLAQYIYVLGTNWGPTDKSSVQWTRTDKISCHAKQSFDYVNVCWRTCQDHVMMWL